VPISLSVFRLASVDLEKRSVEASYKLLEVEAKKTQADLKKSLSCVGLLKQEYHSVAKVCVHFTHPCHCLRVWVGAYELPH